MKDTEGQVRRKVLYDLPTSSDAFHGGGHARTASSLANTIVQFDEQTRSIGLEGKWGSGKSTIVEIAKKDLDVSNNGRDYYMFTYDLWANQTSNFRRTFLEGFLSWLVSVDETQAKFAKRMRDKIRDRTVDTRTTNVKLFSSFGLVVLAFVVALPWLYMWLSPAALNGATGIPRLTIVAAVLVSVMVVSTGWVAISKYRASPRESAEKRLSWVEAVSQTLSVFSKDAEIVHTKQNIREADPSQTEFETTLKEILSSFQTDKRRIILVFDNIDRLQSEKIVEAWSDIRAVLSSSRHDDGAANKVTVIVPYDRNHILRAMYPDSGSENQKESVHHGDVFRKSFDAIFFVSPPVLSDAVDFFDAKLKEALGHHVDKNMAYRAYKIFDLSRSGEAATPRQVIAFINAIATLWEQWWDKIKLPTIAVYMIHRDLIDKNPDQLRAQEFIDPRYRELSDDDELFRNLAALAFNIEPQYAFQVLLHSRIENVFTSSDVEAAQELSRSPGFSIILPEVYEEGAARWASDSVTQFKYAVRNLSELDKDSPGVTQSKKKLVAAAPALQKVAYTEWETSQELLALYRLCTLDERRQLTLTLAIWLVTCLPDKDDARTFTQGQHWIAFISAMARVMTEMSSRDEAVDALANIPFPASYEFLLGAAYGVEPSELSISDFKRAGSGEGLLSTALAERVVEQPEEFFYAWPQVKQWVPTDAIPGFLESLGAALSTINYANNPEAFRYLVGNYNILYESGEALESLPQARRQLVRSGSLFHGIYVLRESKKDGGPEGRAAALWTILDLLRSKQLTVIDPHHPHFGDISEPKLFVQDLIEQGSVEPFVLDRLVEETVRSNKLDEWIVAAAAAPSRTGLLQAIIKSVVLRQEFEAARFDTVVSNYDFLKDLLGEQMESLLHAVSLGSDPETYQLSDYSDLPTTLIEDVSKRKEYGWNVFLDELDKWLRSIDSAGWQKALTEDAQAADILRARVQLAALTLTPGALRGPITDHVVAVLAGEVNGKEGLDDIVKALPPNNRDAVASDILARLAGATVTAAGFESALASSSELLGRLPFDQYPETTIRKLLIPAIQSGSNATINFLEANRAVWQKFLKSISPALRGEVEEYIGDNAGDDNETKRHIRFVLGLPPLQAPGPKKK